MRARSAAILCTAALLALPAGAAAIVEKGKFTPGKGARGVQIGMTKSQVLAKLGKPVYKNTYGYMQYAKKNLFDVYLDTSVSPKRVRMIGISGPKFCLAGAGFCMYDKGAVGKLKKRYGSDLVLTQLESGESVYRLTRTANGCTIYTDFTPSKPGNKARIVQIFILTASGSAC